MGSNPPDPPAVSPPKGSGARGTADIAGQSFGAMLVLRRAGRDCYGRALWTVRCRECKSERAMRSDTLQRQPGCSSKCAREATPQVLPPARPDLPWPPLLTVPDVASRLMVTTARVYALIDSGQLGLLRVGNADRVSEASLAAYLKIWPCPTSDDRATSAAQPMDGQGNPDVQGSDSESERARPEGAKEKRRRHDPETVANALRRIADGESEASVARSLGVHPMVVHHWRSREARANRSRVPDSYRVLLDE